MSPSDASDEGPASLERKYITLLEQKGTERSRSKLGTDRNGQKDDKPSSINDDSDVDDEPKIPSNADAKDLVNDEDIVNPRMRLLDSRYNEKTGMWEEQQSRQSKKAKEMGPDLEYAFTWLKNFNDEHKYSSTKVTINSDELETLIKENCRASSQPNFRSFTGVLSPYPSFAPLVWDWDKLSKAAESTDDSLSQTTKQAREDLSLLLEQVRASPELQPYFEKWKDWKKSNEIEYDYLWTLFPPGEMVYAEPITGYSQAFITREMGQYQDMERRNRRTDSFFELSCWSYDWNGETFNRVGGSLRIDKYIGPKAINSLSFYPIAHHTTLSVAGNDPANQKNILLDLKNRGERFREFCISPRGSQLFRCNGPVFSHQLGLGAKVGALNSVDSDTSSTLSGADDEFSSVRTSKVVGPVIIDHKAYLQHSGRGLGPVGSFVVEDSVSECSCSACKRNNQLKNMMKVNYDNWSGDKAFEEDDQYIICSCRLLGYIMNSKAWAQIPVASVKKDENKVKEDAFDNLIMDEDPKRLVRGLVENHEKKKKNTTWGDSTCRDDWIEGKGKGLVILLHGPPGVGKTSTAESVAQATGKPLFTVSVSDIGLAPDKVERSLSEVFELAATWEAVLLFDEADVFLESRGTDKADLNRNTLVTVFLRIHEYYDGILILTTNRIKSFDVAVQSRVHLAIRYKDLTAGQLRQLFTKFVERHTEEMENPKAVMDWIQDEFDTEAEFDGRQIRNIVSSARALAKGEDNPGGQVKLTHIKSVMKMTRAFQNHLRDQRANARRDQVADK